MAAGIDQVRVRQADDRASTPDARLARVDVSGLPLAAVRSFARERGTTPVYVERRGGNTYLVAERA